MTDKVILLDKNADRYIKLANKCVEKEDFYGALGFLFSAEKISPRFDILLSIADVYADMGLYELSNKYLFRYMHRAPADKVAISYEELAINYFYLDNLWASGYYFHKKLSTDGFISKEGLDQEILDFFSGEEFKKNAYRIAYPYNLADYSMEIKNGKRLIALGGFNEAVKTLSKIPSARRDEEISGDLTIALFMDDNLEEAEKVCRDSIARHGENITAYCNLSTIYDMKEDFEKREYYYQKALTLRTGATNESYKIATCAIERDDHSVSERCLETILSERPYENTMRFFYGLTKINLGKYDQAERELKTAYRTDPTDAITAYYLDLAKRLQAGDEKAKKLLPLKYVKELPKNLSAKRATSICGALKTPEKMHALTKSKENRDLYIWGMLYGSDEVMRASVLVLSSTSTRNFKKLIEPFLLNPEVRDELKRLLIYLLIVKGDKSKIGVVSGCFYTSFNPSKLKCEKDCGESLYLSAYALCMSKILFYDLEDYNKVAVQTERVYKAFNGIITESEVTNEELAGFILYNCKYDKFKKLNDAKKLFDISNYKFEKLKNILDEREGKKEE